MVPAVKVTSPKPFIVVALTLFGMCSVAAAADRPTPFNGAVHTAHRGASDDDDSVTEPPHLSDAGWRNLELRHTSLVTRKSWQVPQWREDENYVRLRGWFTAVESVTAGTIVFELPVVRVCMYVSIDRVVVMCLVSVSTHGVMHSSFSCSFRRRHHN